MTYQIITGDTKIEGVVIVRGKENLVGRHGQHTLRVQKTRNGIGHFQKNNLNYTGKLESKKKRKVFFVNKHAVRVCSMIQIN